jgi:hypothetical protein
MAFPQTILPLKTEIFVNSVWTDITSKVYSRDPITIKRGTANEGTTIEPGTLNLTLNNRDGRFSPRNPTGTYFGQIGRNTPIRQSVVGLGYLQIEPDTGTTPAGGASVTTPDAASLDITTQDLDLRFDADLTSWRESMEFITKWTTTGNQRSYGFALGATGTLIAWMSTDGSATTGSVQTSLVVPITTGRLAVRMTIDVNNGLGGRTVTFYTAPTMAGPWTQFGGQSITTSGTAPLFSSSAVVGLVDNPNSNLGGSVIRGRVYGAQIYSGIGGTLVANADFSVVANGATSFVDSTGKTWTLNGEVEASTRDIRASMEVSGWPQKWDPTGRDVYTPIEAAGIFRRLSQGQAPLSSVLRSGILTLTNLVAYWPMEDGEGSTRIATPFIGGSTMAPYPDQPDYAANSQFKASAPILNASNQSLAGPVKTYTSTGNIQVRFLMAIPAAGTTNNAVICRILCGGTAPRWDLVYGTGGNMSLQPYDSSDVAIGAGSGLIAFDVNGKLLRVSVELSQSGANVSWNMVTLQVGASSGGSSSGSLASRTVTRAIKIVLNNSRNMDDVALGHLSVEKAITSIFDLSNELKAYTGEAAGRRMQRLCREQGIAFQGDGDLDDTVLMGPQLPQTLMELVQDCADTDMGVLYEPRDRLAIGYRPLSALYGQEENVTLSYSSHEMNDLEPIEDDQNVRNDITVTKPEGSSSRAVLETGTLSILDPPSGIGTYNDAVESNVASDSQLDDQAGWRLRLGTIDEARFPRLSLNLANPAFATDATLSRQAAALDVGSRLVITDVPAWLPPEDISQQVRGTVETFSQYQWDLDLNLVPSVPYDSVGFYGVAADAVFVARYSSDGTVTAEALDTTETGVDINTPSGPVWTTVDGSYDVIVGGERMTVTAISGTTALQTATVIRSVNGVVKSHAAGAVFELFQPAYYAL